MKMKPVAEDNMQERAEIESGCEPPCLLSWNLVLPCNQVGDVREYHGHQDG